ncbi:MAG: bifunctional histidinol-phosphatase/imidazoleglycerol-phosphate dehydratase HisB [bacterium]|jgi:imidazoleglycerol-phosphate dehydratase/histidinol-phosphatase|nr:bifunctional histidinol-phosphatase/imidazoleglycerol-phosphate dehydratase HisB [bacterium]
MKKILFIDRDGTIIAETEDERIDTLEKMQFLPGVIRALSDLTRSGEYTLVMVTNQDGLGRPDFPRERFELVQEKMLQILKNEGIEFSAIHIDDHYEEELAATRKPGTAMLSAYMNAEYDLAGSWVIGDRDSDMQLAKNLHAKGIFLGKKHPDAEYCSESWEAIRNFLLRSPRSAHLQRMTRETEIAVEVLLDGKGKADIDTGIGFFNHMLELFVRHSGIDAKIFVKGDLQVDAHHSIEDTALVLGEAIRKALGSKRGIERYGFYLPMDEAAATVTLDLSGRSYFQWEVKLHNPMCGDFPTDMLKHFFRSFADALGCNLHIRAQGENDHHVIEAVFKAVARSCRQAFIRSSDILPSTKGVL